MTDDSSEKICNNCEGSVDIEVIFCPHCGSDMAESYDIEDSVQKEHEDNLEKTNESLYPSAHKQRTDPDEKKSSFSSLFSSFATIFFTFSAWTFTIGIILFSMGNQGAISLTLEASDWIHYMVLSVPLFFIGLYMWQRS